MLLKIHVKAMTLEEAIRTIQVAERARQGRCRVAFMKQIYLEEKRKGQTKLQVQVGPNPDDAATCIQKVNFSDLTTVLAEGNDNALFRRTAVDRNTAQRIGSILKW